MRLSLRATFPAAARAAALQSRLPRTAVVAAVGGADALDRRRALAATLAAAAALAGGAPPRAAAIQGSTAGRIPGVTGPGADGLFLYTRPEGKSGGHGVGWSEIPRYSFKVPAGWEETPVSIADLGGTEIDCRYGKPDGGGAQVVVAPVLRFAEVGYNADVSLTDLFPGGPERMIEGFFPELFGAPLQEGEVLSTETGARDGLPYFYWECKPHRLVAATATGNRVFMLALTANSRQWRKSEGDLRAMWRSFRVPPARR